MVKQEVGERFSSLDVLLQQANEKKIGSHIIVKEQISQFHEIIRDCNK